MADLHGLFNGRIAFSSNLKILITIYENALTIYPTLPMDVNAVMKQNFVYRMVFGDIYWF